jgi:hypothetical protein
MITDYKLKSKDNITSELKTKGIHSWKKLTDFVKKIPYGRNTNRHDLALVVKEYKGTCSSKHALLKEVANLNEIPDIKLILGMYRMNSTNTPNIGDVLDRNNLDFIPEAHCYLKVNGERIDYTSNNSDFNRIKNAILIEKEIEPHQVVKYKVDYHRAFVKIWIKEHEIPFSFYEIWDFREQCIANLSNSNT